MTKKKTEIQDMVTALVELEAAATVRIAQELNTRAVDPIDIMTACEQALVEIGERYATGEYFISGLIMAGEIMNRVITMVAPRMAENVVNILRGKVIIGTVKGDIHGLGKNIAGALLSAYGFEVKDLGVDVPIDEFVEGCRLFNPDIVGLSVLLTSCYQNLGETIQAIRDERGVSETPVIFISGAQVTAEHQKQYQADHYAKTAFDTVRLCEKIVRRGLGTSAARPTGQLPCSVENRIDSKISRG